MPSPFGVKWYHMRLKHGMVDSVSPFLTSHTPVSGGAWVSPLFLHFNLHGAFFWSLVLWLQSSNCLPVYTLLLFTSLPLFGLAYYRLLIHSHISSPGYAVIYPFIQVAAQPSLPDCPVPCWVLIALKSSALLNAWLISCRKRDSECWFWCCRIATPNDGWIFLYNFTTGHNGQGE